MTSRIGAEMPPHAPAGANTLKLPEFLREPFSAAMSQSVLLPAFVVLFGIVAALFLVGFTPSALTRNRVGARLGRVPDDGDMVDDDYDDYVEYILRREPDDGPRPEVEIKPVYQDEADTEPLVERVHHPRPAPADTWHSAPVDSWHSLLNDPESEAELIGLAHNGSQVDNEKRFRQVAGFSPPARRQTGSEGAHARSSGSDSSAPHQHAGGEPPRNKHYRAEPEDPVSGRYSS
jgi:hypothetical protein